MALADVEVILNALDEGRQAAFKREQLKQQQTQFQADLDQRVKEHQAVIEQQKANLNLAQLQLRGQIAQHPETIPYMGGKLVSDTGLDTKGLPGYPSNRQFGYQFGGMNDPETGQPLTINVSSPETYAEQQANIERTKLKPQTEAQKDILGFQAEQARGLEKIRNANALTLRQVEDTAAMDRLDKELKSRGDLSDKEIQARKDIAKMERDAQYSIADMTRKSQEKITGWNLGMGDPSEPGTFANRIHSAATDAYLWDNNINDIKQNFPIKGQQNQVLGNLLDIGGKAPTKEQQAAVNSVSMMKNIIGQIDKFNELDPIHWQQKKQIQDNIRALVGNLVTTVDATGKSRMTQKLIDQANEAYNVSRWPVNTNVQTRDNIINVFRSYIDEQMGNVSQKQKDAILYHKGYNDLKTTDEMKKTGDAKDAARQAIDEYNKRNGIQ